MQNIEFKAELRDLDLARTICHAIAATHIASLEQTDTYYRIADGRLKKREAIGEPAEVIFYRRDNRATVRPSEFTILTEAEAQLRYGTQPLHIWVVVRKTRDLWLSGATRIHLDRVEGLGTFIEFESLVSRTNPASSAHEHVAALREQFRPAMGGAIDCSYSDMLARDQESTASTFG
jgi:adenylate cyclase class IV